MSPTFEALPAFVREYLSLPARAGVPGGLGVQFAPDGRATFHYGDEVSEGEPHVVWRRIGDHSILDRP